MARDPGDIDQGDPFETIEGCRWEHTRRPRRPFSHFRSSDPGGIPEHLWASPSISKHPKETSTQLETRIQNEKWIPIDINWRQESKNPEESFWRIPKESRGGAANLWFPDQLPVISSPDSFKTFQDSHGILEGCFEDSSMGSVRWQLSRMTLLWRQSFRRFIEDDWSWFGWTTPEPPPPRAIYRRFLSLRSPSLGTVMSFMHLLVASVRSMSEHPKESQRIILEKCRHKEKKRSGDTPQKT